MSSPDLTIKHLIGTRGSWWMLEYGKIEIDYLFKKEVRYEYGIWLHLVKVDVDAAQTTLTAIFRSMAAGYAAWAGTATGGVTGGAAGTVVAPGPGTAGGAAGGAAAFAAIFAVVGDIMGQLASWGLGEVLRHMIMNADGTLDVHMSPTSLGFGKAVGKQSIQIVDPNVVLPGIWEPIRRKLQELQPKPKRRMKASSVEAESEKPPQTAKILKLEAVPLPVVPIDVVDADEDAEPREPATAPTKAPRGTPAAVNNSFDAIKSAGGHILVNGAKGSAENLAGIWRRLDADDRRWLKRQFSDAVWLMEVRSMPLQYISEDEGLLPLIKISAPEDGSSFDFDVEWPKKMPRQKKD